MSNTIGTLGTSYFNSSSVLGLESHQSRELEGQGLAVGGYIRGQVASLGNREGSGVLSLFKPGLIFDEEPWLGFIPKDAKGPVAALASLASFIILALLTDKTPPPGSNSGGQEGTKGSDQAKSELTDVERRSLLAKPELSEAEVERILSLPKPDAPCTDGNWQWGYTGKSSLAGEILLYAHVPVLTAVAVIALPIEVSALAISGGGALAFAS
ncbi:MAG: hypothetical protein KDK66_02535 [Deltaproteobacteria bacterium]|nr:hypothetical protein [Deltaproteobacteria bacterium]